MSDLCKGCQLGPMSDGRNYESELVKSYGFCCWECMVSFGLEQIGKEEGWTLDDQREVWDALCVVSDRAKGLISDR